MASIDAKELLDFEERWARWSSRKDEAIRARFRMSPARYFQLLGRVLDTREALEVNPMLMHRLLRMREDRRAARERRIAG